MPAAVGSGNHLQADIRTVVQGVVLVIHFRIKAHLLVFAIHILPLDTEEALVLPRDKILEYLTHKMVERKMVAFVQIIVDAPAPPAFTQKERHFPLRTVVKEE